MTCHRTMQETAPNPLPDYVIELSAGDLAPHGTVACPSARTGMPPWASHPRVYLQPDENGQTQCPYCGTVYKLATGKTMTHSH